MAGITVFGLNLQLNTDCGKNCLPILPAGIFSQASLAVNSFQHVMYYKLVYA